MGVSGGAVSPSLFFLASSRILNDPPRTFWKNLLPGSIACTRYSELSILFRGVFGRAEGV
jgi:hypothetical protein